MHKLSVIIPVYNEARHLREVIASLLASPCPVEREWIFVDDFSTDGSREILREFAAQIPSFKVIFNEHNVGKGASVRRGIHASTGDLVMVQDADFEYDPGDIPRLLTPALDGRADVVYGSRFKKNAEQVHRTYHYFVNRLLTFISNLLSGIYLTDMETCYKIFKGDLIRGMTLTSNRFGFEVEVTAYVAKLNARVYEMPISYRPRTRQEGKKIGWRDGIAALYHLVIFNLLTSTEDFWHGGNAAPVAPTPGSRTAQREDRKKRVYGQVWNAALAFCLFALIHYGYYRFLELDFGKFKPANSYWLMAGLVLVAVIGQAKPLRKLIGLIPTWAWTVGIVWTIANASLRIIREGQGPFTGGGDAAFYYDMLRRLAGGNFDAGAYVYGLGYPILGMFAAPLYPADPLRVVSAFSYGITLLSLFAIVLRITKLPLAAVLATLFFAKNAYFIDFTTWPWTSTVTLACFAAMAAAALHPTPSWWRAPVVGLAAGITFATRYVDVLLFLPLLTFWLVSMWKRRTSKAERIWLGVGAAIAASFAIAVAYSHYHYFGDVFQTPYHSHYRPEGGTDQSPGTYTRRLGIPMLIHVIGSLIDPTISWDYPGPGRLEPVFVYNTYLFFGLIGIWYLYRNLGNRQRRELNALAVGMVLFLIVYALHPGSYPGCLPFGSAHYFKPVVLTLFVGGIVFFIEFIRDVAQRRRYLTHVAMMLGAIVGLDLLAVWASPRQYAWIFSPGNQVNRAELAGDAPVDFALRFRNRFGYPIFDSVMNDHAYNVRFIGKKKDGNSVTEVVHMAGGNSEWLGTFDPGTHPDVSEWKASGPSMVDGVVTIRRGQIPSASSQPLGTIRN